MDVLKKQARKVWGEACQFGQRTLQKIDTYLMQKDVYQVILASFCFGVLTSLCVVLSA